VVHACAPGTDHAPSSGRSIFVKKPVSPIDVLTIIKQLAEPIQSGQGSLQFGSGRSLR
jgi:hypothetical protein